MLEKRKLIDTFMQLVTIDSESGHEKELAEYITSRLEELGLTVKFDEANKAYDGEIGNLIATWPGTKDEEPFLLTAHMDTVSPGCNVRPKLRDDVITSSGPTILGADDKAGVAAILTVLQTIKEKELPHPPLEVVFTVSEEKGLAGSAGLDFSQFKAKRGLCLDGSDLGSFILSAPYKAILDVEVGGYSSHAANPQRGVNAIQVAAQAVSKMHLGLVDDETTCNIGTFSSEGQINVIPDKARLQLEVRSRDEDKLQSQIDHINRCFREGAASFVARRPDGERRPSISASTKRMYDGYTINNEDPFVKEVVKATEELDISPILADGMGGTDANHFMKNGVKVLIMGVGIHEAHTTREWISTYEFFKASRLLLRIVTKK